jgi:3-methyladenine DNA glycosylase AlkD
MTTTEILSRLEAAGNETTRKTLLRHGAKDPLYGVKYADLYKLEKEIKRVFKKASDALQTLALELWATGNHDAQVLATLLADGTRMDEATIDQWMSDCGTCHFMVDAVTGVVAKSSFAALKREAWRQSDDEWIGRAGWRLVSEAAADPTTDDTYLDERLAEIEANIHQAKNRTREAMNSAVINIGIRGGVWAEKAMATAGRIGKVHIDHGDTSCKTPDAATYIKKTLDYQAAKG